MDWERVDAEFTSGTAICRAWLYRPLTPGEGQRPCIVMAHGLGGTRDAGLEPYAKKFANSGYVVVLFDYRHFGASDGEPRQLFSIKRQLQDWASAIGYARLLNGVDPKRIALWGTSFSGGHVIVAAARDREIAAVSAQGPMMDGFTSVLNVIHYAGITAFLKLGAFGMVDLLRAMFGTAPLYIPLIAPPGELAAMSSHDSASGYGAIVPPHWRNQICSRFGLRMVSYRPIAYAHSLSCPALIQVCMKDSLVPPRSAVATAQKIGPKAELRQYDCGHFDIYVGEYFERASDEQLAFFNRVLSRS
jgi:cephalosporin-C deacetylase-like acetyl esterase